MAFAAALRNGNLDNGKPASGETVERTLQFCGEVLAQRGLDNPCWSDKGQANLDRALSNQLKAMKREDPAPMRQQALPSSTVELIARLHGSSPVTHLRMVGASVTLAFHFPS